VDKVDGAPNQYAQFIDEADGLEKIENLQNHNNNDIYDKAMKILEEYFGLEEEEAGPGPGPSHPLLFPPAHLKRDASARTRRHRAVTSTPFFTRPLERETLPRERGSTQPTSWCVSIFEAYLWDGLNGFRDKLLMKSSREGW